MKIKSVISFSLVFVTLISCHKTDKECIYDWSKPLNDTSLFIRFSFNQNEYNLFQVAVGGTDRSMNTFLTYNGQTIINNDYKYLFRGDDEFPTSELTFWDTSLVVSTYNIPIRGLAKRIKNKYNFTYPRRDQFDFSEPLPTDTGFMNGASLEIKLSNDTFSTRNLLTYFNYNYDTIYNEILKDSNLSIKSVILTCNGYKLISGEFSTLVMNSPKEEYLRKTIKLEGKFKFVTN